MSGGQDPGLETGPAPGPGTGGGAAGSDRSYLDAGSSAAPLADAVETVRRALPVGYADPRRLHHEGRTARLLLDNAREATAEALAVRPDEVTFTPSGTHAVHLGLVGLHAGRARPGSDAAGRPARRLVHTAVEHSSVLHAASWTGDPVTVVPVEPDGRVRVDDVAAALDADVPAGVVAVQAANHEVGSVQPVAEIARTLGDVPLFVDACASMGHLALPDGWTTAAGSAHKWGGPAGVGVLLVRRGARWRNPFPADDRTDERATGFENVPAALAAAAALQATVADRDETGRRQHELVARIREQVGAMPDTEVVGHPDDRLPHLVTFSVLYVSGEALVTELDRLGLAVDSGSACTASTLEPSHVLAAMGALTHGNVRVSLSPDSTGADVDRLLTALPGVIERLRREAGV